MKCAITREKIMRYPTPPRTPRKGGNIRQVLKFAVQEGAKYAARSLTSTEQGSKETFVGGGTESHGRLVYKKKKLSKKSKRKIKKFKKRATKIQLSNLSSTTVLFNGYESVQLLANDRQYNVVSLLGASNGVPNAGGNLFLNYMGLKDLKTIIDGDNRIDNAAESLFVESMKYSCTVYNNWTSPLELDVYFCRVYPRNEFTFANPVRLLEVSATDSIEVTNAAGQTQAGIGVQDRGFTLLTLPKAKQYGMHVISQKKYLVAPKDTVFLNKFIKVGKKVNVRKFVSAAATSAGTGVIEENFVSPFTYVYWYTFKSPSGDVMGQGSTLDFRASREYKYKVLSSTDLYHDRWIAPAQGGDV